jgi:hypothetical protein
MGCMPQDGYWGDRIKLLYAEGAANARELLVVANSQSNITFANREGEYGHLPYYGFNMQDIKTELRSYDPEKRNASGNTPQYGPKYDPPQRIRILLTNATPAENRRLRQMIYLSNARNGQKITLLNMRQAIFQEPSKIVRGKIGTFVPPPSEPVLPDIEYYWPIHIMQFAVVEEESFCDRFTGRYSVSLDGTEIDLSAGSDRAVF